MANEFDLRPDGTAVITIKGATWVLPRPTLGEYRDAFEVFEAADQTLKAAMDAIPDDKAGDRVKLANKLQLGDADTPPLYGQVLVDLIALVSPGGDPPSVLELPAWAVSSDASARLLRHWRAVPLDPGPLE
jgi:hypothetical protein